MPTPQSASDLTLRLDRLLSYLAADPANLALQADAAHAAYDAGRHDVCEQLLDTLAQHAPLSAPLLNLRGINALASGAPERALQTLGAIPAAERHPITDFNIAYAHALLGQYEQAATALTEPVLRHVPEASGLAVRVLLHLQRLDAAIAVGQHYASGNPDTAGALAVALFDTGDLESARMFAGQSGQSVDGCTIGGLLALQDGQLDQAEAAFKGALKKQPSHARSKLGLGLAHMARQQFDQAGALIDEAAQAFQNHAGAWLAAGWAYLYQGDLRAARERFDHAAQVDRGFAEAHGSLAVLDCKEGRLDSAQRHAEIALKLDRASMSAALALSLIQATQGNPELAQRTIDAALQRPISDDGRTLAQALAAYAGAAQPSNRFVKR